MLGRLAKTRHTQTVNGLHTQLVHVLARDPWPYYEQRVAKHRSLKELDDLVVPKVPNYGRVLGLLRGSRDPDVARTKFLSASDQFAVCKDPARVALAWQLVFDPRSARDLRLLGESLADPALQALIRGARLIQLGMREEAAK